MSEEEKKETVKALVPIDPKTGQLQPTDLEGMWRIATIMAHSEMVPSDYRKKPEKVFVAMQLGQEVGLGYMSAIQTIAVINGKPAIYGDGIPAIVQSRGKCKKWEEFFILKDEMTRADRNKHYAGPANLNEWPDELTAVCILERDGFDEPFEAYFSVADAKRMGKWNKPESTGALSVWQKYPLRMLKMRARGFATRDGFSDHLKGIGIVEELQDIAPAEYVNTVVDKPVEKDSLDAVLEAEAVEPTVSTQEERSPQEEPLSEPEVAKQAIKHPLVQDLEGKGYSPYLIDQFCTFAAEQNEMDVISLQNAAMEDIEGFEKFMVEYAGNHDLETKNTAPDSEEEDAIDPALAASIEESAAACQKAGEVMDNAEVPDEGRMVATEDGVIEQERKQIKKKEDLEPNADIDGWVSRFNQQYRLKNKHQFSPFVLQNEDKFRQLFEYSPDLYDKAVEKWTRFYGDEPWPVVLDPERDQIDGGEPTLEDVVEMEGTAGLVEEPYLHKGPIVKAEPKKVSEQSRLFKDEEFIDQKEKLKRMRQYWPTELDKVLTNLKMGKGGLSDAAVDVAAFALKEEIKKTQAREAKGKA